MRGQKKGASSSETLTLLFIWRHCKHVPEVIFVWKVLQFPGACPKPDESLEAIDVVVEELESASKGYDRLDILHCKMEFLSRALPSFFWEVFDPAESSAVSVNTEDNGLIDGFSFRNADEVSAFEDKATEALGTLNDFLVAPVIVRQEHPLTDCHVN